MSPSVQATASPLTPGATVDELAFDPASPVYQVLEVLISPKLATAILETRAPNRTIAQRFVDQFARDMKAGHWMRNGETIKFDRFGRLLDGQHRLWAVIEADTAVDFTVVLGLEPDAMHTVDTGRPRSFSDVLTINGGSNTRALAAIVRMAWMYERNVWAGCVPSHSDLGAVLSRFPDLHEWVREYKTERVTKLGQTSALMFTSYMGQRVDVPAARRFMDALASGTDLHDESPLYHLRERLLTWRTSQGSGRARPTALHVVQLCIKAWNAHLIGKTIRHFRIMPTEFAPVFDPQVPGLKNPAPERRLADKEG